MVKLTVPDFFSLYRLFAAPVLAYSIFKKKQQLFIMLAIISLASDSIDGFLARLLKQETSRGAKLDSLGDLATMQMMTAGLFRFKKAFLKDHKISLNVIIILYAVQVLMAVYKYKRPSSFHTYSAKIAFSTMGIFYILFFYGKKFPGLYLIAASLLIISLLEDMILVYLLKEPKQNVKGVYWVVKEQKRL
ncbi:CDP-alcohol phosphatidyltransferase family protein [Daejeonella oryzae]|uniref:CDP-alcohol phosphatidyltransferase family protein n=1 Tax=Daejeonella oryzae TaxID=1122943 RepID=UPI0004146150|nr:CDP-alcohol phosphatidyltransferase family protein [Daejeonella oryzae]